MRRTGSAILATREALSVLALVTLCACTVGPVYTRPSTPVPQTWRAAENPTLETHAQADSTWWREFQDPVLERLIELAYQQNLPLQVAGLRIAEARAQLGIATGRQWPQMQVAVAAVTAQRLNAAVAEAAALGRDYLDYQLALDASWELDLWGKYRRGIEAESERLRASVADRDSALVSLSAEVARTYVLVRTYEVLVDLAVENARVQEEGLRIANSRFTSGATSELDVAQAATLLESTRATIPRLQAVLDQARNAMGTLLGQPAGTVDQLLAGQRQIPQVPGKVAVGVPADIIRRRPDVRSAELNAASQAARVGVAKAELFPSLYVLGDIGFHTYSAASANHNLFSNDNLVYSVGPRIVWPFLNYGRIENSVRVEDARLQQLLVSYRDTVLRAVQEAEDAMTALLNAQQAMLADQRSVESARRAVEIALVQYREGATDFQRVLDAERTLLQQQNSLAQNTSSAATSLILLYKALGGGWESRRGQPAVPGQAQEEMGKRTNWGNVLKEPRGPETTENAAPGKP